MKIKFSKKIAIFLSFLLIISLVFWRARTSGLGKTPQETIVHPQIRDLSTNLTLAGIVDAQNKADLKFQTSGYLSWVGVKVGDRVKKWQAIASLDRRQLQKQLQKQFNLYKSSLDTFNDTQDEYKEEKDNLVLTDEMKRILNRSQNTLDNSVIDYELSELSLKYATLSTPIDGVIIKADPPVAGVNVTPATAVYTIVDPDSLFFTAEVDQEDVINLHVGQEATLTLDSFPDKPLDSKITYISFSPLAATSSTTYEVRFALNPDANLRLGMTGDADITTSTTPEALSIPLEALQPQDGGYFVYVKDNGKNVARDIQTGTENDQYIQVISGLSPDDQVVIVNKK